ARDRGVDLLPRRLRAALGHRVDAIGEFVRARRKILRDVVEDLRAVVARGAAPSPGALRGLDGVADVLAVALRALSDRGAAGRKDSPRIRAVGPGLLPPDE